MKHVVCTFLLANSILYLSGCAVIRAVDDGVSEVLETIPLLRMIGIESRKQSDLSNAVSAKNSMLSREGAGSKNPALVQIPPKIERFFPGPHIDPVGLIPGEPLLELLLEANSFVNPNAMERSSPVRVVILEMQDALKFWDASARTLLSESSKVPSPDIRRRYEMILAPGEKFSLVWPMRQPGYLGILVDFRAQPNAPRQDRQVIALTGLSPWHVHLSGTTVVASPNAAIPPTL